nr:toprim domain-containing protein [Pseudomonas sp. ACN8]
MSIEQGDTVYVVEGIFHAIALILAGYKAIAAISANNFPWDTVEAHKCLKVRWIIALDDDKAGHSVIPKYRSQLLARDELAWVALAGTDRDWDDVYSSASTPMATGCARPMARSMIRPASAV